MADALSADGSLSAKLCIVVDAPGHWEHVYGKLLVGPSYTDHLKPWWAACTPQLSREQFYITSVLDVQPAQGVWRVSEAEWREGIDKLHARLATLTDPYVIVPMGDYGLYALTGKGRVSYHNRDGRWERPALRSWRGSIMAYEDRRGRTIKVIPAVHPNELFRAPQLAWVCQKDWQRIAEDAAFRELRLPQPTHMISPSIGEVREYANWTQSEARKRAIGKAGTPRLMCSLDVETPNKVEYEIRQKELGSKTAKCATCGHTRRWHVDLAHEIFGDATTPASPITCTKKAPKKEGGRQCTCGAYLAPMGKARQVKTASNPYLGCVGYAWRSDISLTVPTTLAFWHEQSRLDEAMEILRQLHADPYIDWLGQNFLFDAWWCAESGVPLSTIRWDTMKMHRVLKPWSAWHDLAFQGSLYTRHPYWKDEAKDPDSVSKYAHNNEALWTYNGIDNIVQLTLAEHHIPALAAAGRLDYYNELEAPIDRRLLPLSRTGIRMDEAGAAKERASMLEQAGALASELNELAGRKLVTKTAVRNKELQAYLYGPDGLRLPEQYKTVKTKTGLKEKRVTVDVVAVKRLMERYPGLTALQSVGQRVLRHRRVLKVAGFLEPTKLVAGRWFAMFKQDTLLGRLSSAATPKGDGANLQNADRKLRRFFLPEATL